jgi:hypothetical protein
MKRKILVALSGLALAAPSHALVGIAVSGGLNSTSISGSDQTIVGADLPAAFSSGNGNSLVVHRGSMSGLTQLGLKAWLELPVIPIEFEVSSNVGWGSYKSSLIFNKGDGSTPDTIPVDVKSPVVGLGDKSGSTPYVSVLNDLTLRYPILKLPPLAPIQPLKIWIGGGATYAVASRVVEKSDLQSVFSGSYTTKQDATNTFKDNILTSTWGGHLAVGAQLKIPVIPIALFIDGKWYIHTATSDAASKYPFAVNAGLGLSI